MRNANVLRRRPRTFFFSFSPTRGRAWPRTAGALLVIPSVPSHAECMMCVATCGAGLSPSAACSLPTLGAKEGWRERSSPKQRHAVIAARGQTSEVCVRDHHKRCTPWVAAH